MAMASTVTRVDMATVAENLDSTAILTMGSTATRDDMAGATGMKMASTATPVDTVVAPATPDRIGVTAMTLTTTMRVATHLFENWSIKANCTAH